MIRLRCNFTVAVAIACLIGIFCKRLTAPIPMAVYTDRSRGCCVIIKRHDLVFIDLRILISNKTTVCRDHLLSLEEPGIYISLARLRGGLLLPEVRPELLPDEVLPEALPGVPEEALEGFLPGVLPVLLSVLLLSLRRFPSSNQNNKNTSTDFEKSLAGTTSP